MSYINEVKKLRNSKPSDDRIREVCNVMSGNYKMSSLLEIVMEYYTLCEMIAESLNPELENAGKELEVINDAVRIIADRGSISGMSGRLLETRSIITRKMNCVTAYVDRFLVYEYVLGRFAPSFEMTEEELASELEEFNKAECTNELLQYIFSTQDNTEVNERLLEVLECLPVRMSRKKYLSMVESGLSLYEDSDKASFDEYIYMLRTSGMLYECEDPEGLFEAYEQFSEELKSVDYKTLDKDYYKILSEKIYNVTVSLNNTSDVYMCLQKIINMLYIYAVNENVEVAGEYKEFVDISCGILAGLHDVIMDEKRTNDMPEEGLVKLEGYMEELYEVRNMLLPACEDISLTYDSRIRELGLSESFDNITVSDRLFRSLFAELEASGSEMITGAYLKEKATALVADLEALIQGSSKYVVRAVISNTFGKLPLPFRTSEDIKDYIYDALEHCSDKSELVAVKRSIASLIV